MSAPAMKLSGLPEMSTTARIAASSRSRMSSASNSTFTASLSLLTGSPGRSKVTTAMPSSTTVVKRGHSVALQHQGARPCRPARRSRSARTARRAGASRCASVVTSRAPVAPNGWPIAIEPPITLVRSQSTSPTGPGSPSRSAQACEPHACTLREHLRGEGLVDLDQAEVAPGDARRARAPWAPRTPGPSGAASPDRPRPPRSSGGRPAARSPARRAFSSAMSSTAAAPSVSGDELPAVTVP